MSENELKKQLLVGFISLAFKYNDIRELRSYLLNFVNDDLGSTKNQNNFYSGPDFNTPELDPYWIENQKKNQKGNGRKKTKSSIYVEDLVQYTKNDEVCIGVVKEIVQNNCVIVMCTANCTSDYDTVFTKDIIDHL